MMIKNELPFKEEDGKSCLTGVCFLSCGCGNVNARWATIAQNLATRIPQGKPKSSRIINNWLEQNELKKRWPVLKNHQYGIVVAETDQGFEMVDIMSGATSKVIENIASLIRRHNEYISNH